MVSINRAEKDAIAERFPHVFIIRTMKQDSKRKHYFMEESPAAMRYLRKLRYGDDYDNRKKGSGYDRTRKTGKRNTFGASQTSDLRQTRR